MPLKAKSSSFLYGTNPPNKQTVGGRLGGGVERGRGENSSRGVVASAPDLRACS